MDPQSAKAKPYKSLPPLPGTLQRPSRNVVDLIYLSSYACIIVRYRSIRMDAISIDLRLGVPYSFCICVIAYGKTRSKHLQCKAFAEHIQSVR